MAVILLFTVFSAIGAGRTSAQAQTVVLAAQNIQTGFKFFYNDQNRIPTAVEFEDKAIMSWYFYNFPQADFISAKCPTSLVYKRISSIAYQLNFCIPVSALGYEAGWVTLHN